MMMREMGVLCKRVLFVSDEKKRKTFLFVATNELCVFLHSNEISKEIRNEQLINETSRTKFCAYGPRSSKINMYCNWLNTVHSLK